LIEKEKTSIRFGIRYFLLELDLALTINTKQGVNLEESLAIFNNSNCTPDFQSNGSLGSLYLPEGDFVKAEEHLLHSLAMAEKEEYS
jgi:hypothetical protein